MFKFLKYLIRFWPLISLAIRIVEEAGDENGWTGPEKKSHAIDVVKKLAGTFNFELPEGFKNVLGSLIDAIVMVFNMLGIFQTKEEKPAVVASQAIAKVAKKEDKPIMTLEEAERIARADFQAIVEGNKKEATNGNQ